MVIKFYKLALRWALALFVEQCLPASLVRSDPTHIAVFSAFSGLFRLFPIGVLIKEAGKKLLCPLDPKSPARL